IFPRHVVGSLGIDRATERWAGWATGRQGGGEGGRQEVRSPLSPRRPVAPAPPPSPSSSGGGLRPVVGGGCPLRGPAFHQTQLAGQLAGDWDDIRRRRAIRLPDQAAGKRGIVPAAAILLRVVPSAQTSPP